MTLTIRPASATDLGAAIKLLEKAGLPVADLTAGTLAFAAERDNAVQGVIGAEVLGACALLRSLVVSANARGAGIGAALVTALEVSCIADRVGELWLLTIDADPFFAKLGYRARKRSEVPDAIRATREFSGLCPDSAVLMSKKIG
jgi:amino-acid N-acetyltransferase